ncbi:hypothetical protein HU765_10875, partial [Pseudomonas sp. SWRI81]|nr:hypothetical protein [Pseudomonas sp. SWRI81]
EVPFNIEAKLIKDNEGGTVIARYEIKRAAGGTSYAEPLEFRVGVAMDLTAPRIKEAPNDTSLNPVDAQTGLTALVDYVGMLAGDKITVTWTGAPGTPAGGSHTAAPWPVTTVGVQEIALVNSVIAFNLGKPVTVSYTVTRGSSEPVPSQLRTLAVGRLPDSALRAPTILQAANNGEGPEFDVTSLTQNAVIRILNWPLIALGQYVWLRLQGTKADNTAWSKTVFQPPSGQTNPTWIAAGRYEHATDKAELQELKDGSSLTLEFKAALGGSQVEAEAVTLPVRTYIVALKPVITSVKDSKDVEIPNAGSTTYYSVTLTGTAEKGQRVQVLDGDTPKGEPTVDTATGIWVLPVYALSPGHHSFTAKALYGGGHTSQPPRTITVVDYTSFDGGDWNEWRPVRTQLVNEGGNYFVRLIPDKNSWFDGIIKDYSYLVNGSRYKISFKFRSSHAGHNILIYAGYKFEPIGISQPTIGWESHSVSITYGFDASNPQYYFRFAFTPGVVDGASYDLDDIRIERLG